MDGDAMSDATNSHSATPTITTWLGRDIRELSREELIVALEWSVRAYHESLQSAIRSSEMHRLFARARGQHD